MVYDKINEKFTLTSGRQLLANGEFRLSLHTGDPRVCFGYDGCDVRAPDDYSDFTSRERAEIAAYMVAAWARWAATGEANES